MKTSHANGKLLLSAEYFVLDGALALAIPTRKGQKMIVDDGKPGQISWKSFLEHDEGPWFEGIFDLQELGVLQSSDEETAERLLELFRSVDRQKPEFWASHLASGVKISTHLEFPREWGLGSSSTLTSLLAHWSGTDPYVLLGDSFGGSGYDLACATASGPVFYQKKGGQPFMEKAPFSPTFSEHLYFVFLGKKQDSREGIDRYRQKIGEEKSEIIQQISALTRQMASSTSLTEWNACVEEHEEIISQALDLPKVKSLYFQDFPGSIKSLGAWGGDFVLTGSERGEGEIRRYFEEQGYEVVLSYREMALGV